MDELKELLDRLREKHQYARRLTEEYDHAMDFASHCTMQGLVEGIEFAIEEIEEFLEGKGPGARVRSQGTSKDKGKDKGKGRDKSEGGGKDRSKGRAKARAGKRAATKAKVKGKKQTRENSKAKVRIGVKGKRRR